MSVPLRDLLHCCVYRAGVLISPMAPVKVMVGSPEANIWRIGACLEALLAYSLEYALV